MRKDIYYALSYTVSLGNITVLYEVIQMQKYFAYSVLLLEKMVSVIRVRLI